MAGNVVGVGDEESLPIGTRIQPFSSTPRSEDWRLEDSTKTTSGQSLYERLGLPEFFSLEVWRASVAELVGTAILVFALDTIAISSFETDTKTPNLMMSALIFLSVTILLLATAPVSGGHINPIVSFSATLIGLISPARAAIYILAQCIGGVLGALALKAVVGNTIENAFSLGGCTLSVIALGPHGPITVGIDTGSALWLEIICSFVFLYASIWMAFDRRQAKVLGPVKVCVIIGAVVGLLVLISSTLTAKKGYSGAGLNPARCVGPALVRGGHLWDGHWVFWVGPIIACLVFYLYVKIIPRRHFHADEFKYDVFTTVKVLFQ
ncbi:probable aquaporin TIP1-2 [Magnolia sinica]|uniref:probable aquaporin TIP1-2 n=1 Tax=Magnolia sinica TaxID=86752 RepID=UPI00265B2ECD|nr:probable aquaporin TIP1-2 [Magnolia sinica]